MSFNRTKVTGRRSLSYYTRTAFFAFRSLGHRPKNVTSFFLTTIMQPVANRAS